MAFARAWAGAPASTDGQGLSDDMALLGAELPAQKRADVLLEANAPFEVAHANWEAVSVFCGSATQWRVAGMGGATGLDYPAVESVMRMCAIRDTADTLARVQVLEATALDVWRKQQQKAAAKKPRKH